MTVSAPMTRQFSSVTPPLPSAEEIVTLLANSVSLYFMSSMEMVWLEVMMVSPSSSVVMTLAAAARVSGSSGRKSPLSSPSM